MISRTSFSLDLIPGGLARLDFPALLLALLLLCGTSGSLSAQVTCPPADPPYGTCFVQAGSYPGDLPYAVTVIDSEAVVVVSDYLSGLYFKLDLSNLNSSSQHASPLGPATYLGVAWNSDEDALYWLVNDQGSMKLAISSSGGNLISETELTLPAGTSTITGLAWNAGTGNLWSNDLQNDVYLELQTDGTFTGNSFQNPESTSTTAGAFGLGLAIILDPITGEYLYDLPVGPPSAQRANQVVRVDETGATQGLFYPLAGVNALGGWIAGIAWTATGSWGGPSEFVVDYTNENVVEVPVQDPNAPSISVVNCTADGDNNVTLTWTNPITYTSIIVSRDGVEIASLDAGEQSYVDSDLDPDTYEYSLKPVPASGTDLPAATCSVVVGFGRLLGQAPHGGSQPGPTTFIGSSNQLLVADDSGLTAWLYGNDLTPAGSLPGPFTSTTTLVGIAWDASNDTLAWLNQDGELIITDLQGSTLSSTTLVSPAFGQLGEITYSTTRSRFIGIDRSVASIFEFDADGTSGPGLESIPPVPSGSSAFIGGITARDTGTTSVCDFAVGSVSDGGVSRIERAVDGTASGIGFDLAPSANSGDIGGISSTENGPFGTPVTYLVGRDNATIYLLSGDLSGTGSDFIRGELAGDGSINIVDVTILLQALFGSGQTPSTCVDAADTNDDGIVDIADAIALLGYLFEGAAALPAPAGSCGSDDSIDNLTCQEFNGC